MKKISDKELKEYSKKFDETAPIEEKALMSLKTSTYYMKVLFDTYGYNECSVVAALMFHIGEALDELPVTKLTNFEMVEKATFYSHEFSETLFGLSYDSVEYKEKIETAIAMLSFLHTNQEEIAKDLCEGFNKKKL